jgi:hypothetical protein
MNKKRMKKLHLNVETIRHLSPVTLGEVAGGEGTFYTAITRCRFSCPCYPNEPPYYSHPDYPSCAVTCWQTCECGV